MVQCIATNEMFRERARLAALPSFVVTVESDGLVMIRCNRPLDQRGVADLRELLGKLGGVK